MQGTAKDNLGTNSFKTTRRRQAPKHASYVPSPSITRTLLLFPVKSFVSSVARSDKRKTRSSIIEGTRELTEPVYRLDLMFCSNEVIKVIECR